MTDNSHTFKTVMRGYDPAEVDRHLQTIAEMISTGAVAELVREQEERLQQRDLAVTAAEAHANELVQQAERELHAARVEADATIEGANAKARAIEHEAQKTLDQARLEAEASEILTEAREAAAAMLETARTDGMRAVEQEVAEYVKRRKREADRLVEQARKGEPPTA